MSKMRVLAVLTTVSVIYVMVQTVETMIAHGEMFEERLHGIRPELATHLVGIPKTVGSKLSCASACLRKNCELLHFSVATNSCSLYDTYMFDDQPAVGGLYVRIGAADQLLCTPLPITLDKGTVVTTGTNYGDTTTYTCDMGYIIGTGSSVRTCTGGIWRGSTPTCDVRWEILGNISVDNGGTFGSWGNAEYCAFGTYAYSYDIKIEPNQLIGDDTALNVIKLHCKSLDLSTYGGSITSATQQWGVWTGAVSECPGQTFITGFTLQVETTEGDESDEDGDETAANWVKVKCRDFAATNSSVEHFIPPGYGNWGTFGSWSSECGANSAVCGIRTRVQGFVGVLPDDTALNDAIMYCCA